MTSVVVIEDDPAILDNIIDTLEAEQFEVAGAINGVIGVELVKKRLPDLIICDVMMPKLDGFGVLQRLREDPKTAMIPFIFLTAKADRSDLRRGMELGADDYVSKPFKPAELMAAVDSRLKRQHTIAAKYETSIRALCKNIIYALPHELRTPLMSIIGFADVLHLDNDRVTPQEIGEMAQHILIAGTRLQRLLENYLVYAQIEIMSHDPEQVKALRNHITPKQTDNIAFVATCIAERYNRESDLRLEFLDDCALGMSKENLDKIVEELVDNAFKFSTPGTSVNIRTTRENQHFVIYLRDYGRGMSIDQVKSMGAYMQFERTLHEQQGLGLGFVIAKRLVELHAGRIKIKSSPDKGTLICVELPA